MKLHNLSICIVLLTLFLNNGFAQPDSTYFIIKIDSLSEIVNQKEATIESNQKLINQLQTDVTYYKEVLKLKNATLKTDYNDINIHINSVKGIKSQNKIIIEGLMENHGVVDKFQTKNMELVDPKGNLYKSYRISYGGEDYLQRFERDIPIKLQIEFNDIIEYAPVYKALTLNIYDNKYPGRSNTVIFRNLEVIWQ